MKRLPAEVHTNLEVFVAHLKSGNLLNGTHHCPLVVK